MTEYDIFLIMCPVSSTLMPPLGLAYIVSYIKQNNFRSQVIDMNIELFDKSDDDHKKLWISGLKNDEEYINIFSRFEEEIDDYVDYILSSNTKIIGFSVHQKNFKFAAQLAKKIKERNSEKIIVFGGPQCFVVEEGCNLPILFYDEVKCPQIDFDIVDIFVVGEGEEIIVEILQRIRDEKTFIDVPGIVVKDKSGLSKYMHRLPPQELDKIAFPKFEEFPLDKYTIDSLPIATSRGCPYKCAYCNNHQLIKGYRFRFAVNVFDEIKFHYTQNGVSSFGFCDLLINGNIKELKRLCELIIDAGYKIGWGAEALIRKEMTLSLLTKMKKAGCSLLTYGTESFSDAVLRKMRKGYTAEDALKVIKLTKESGIKTGINIIVGFPGETDYEFQETVRFIRANAEFIDEIGCCNICFILPISELEMKPEDYNVVLTGDNYWLKWRTIDGENTNYIRVKRARELVNVISNLNIPIRDVNIFDDGYVNKRE